MPWTSDTIGGHLADIFEPPQRSEHPGAIIYLHGVHLARLHENEAFTAEFARHGLPVVAPHTGRSWWTDKICPEFDPALSAERHVIANVLPFVAARWGVKPPSVALLGTSMGGQGALRMAFKHPRLFPIVAALAPALEYQQRFDDPEDVTLRQMYPDAEAVRQDTAILHVHPLNWPRHIWYASDPTDERWHDGAQKLRMKLGALGIPQDYDLETSAGGHSWKYYNHLAPRALAVIVDKLERERLRVE